MADEQVKEQRVLLPTSTSTMKSFMDAAQHHALLLSLKVDELTAENAELARKVDLLGVEINELKAKK